MWTLAGWFWEASMQDCFPDSSAGKESACNAGDLGLIPWFRRSPGKGKGYPHQYSGLENSMDCLVYVITKSRTWFSNFHMISDVEHVSMCVLSCGSDDEESVCNALGLGSILGSGRDLGKENGNLIQYSCLENSLDRGAWWATLYGISKSQTWLSNGYFHFGHLQSLSRSQ